jgi:hypothetical protein
MGEIKVTLKGTFSNRDASIDEHPIALVGTGASQSAQATLPAGSEHKLRWVVTGEPGVRYTVALSGDTEAWSEDFTLVAGRDAGFKRFVVR